MGGEGWLADFPYQQLFFPPEAESPRPECVQKEKGPAPSDSGEERSRERTVAAGGGVGMAFAFLPM